MSASIRFTEADRDERGRITRAEPRSLADLLPTPAAIKQDAARAPWTRQELGMLAVVALAAAFVLVYVWATPSTPAAVPAPRVTTVATAPAIVPTGAPVAVPAALVGYFDYTDPASVAPITANQITRVIGTAGDTWRLVAVGSARVWIATALLPTGIPAADPLPDLAPRQPAPPANAPVLAMDAPAVPTDPPPPPCLTAGAAAQLVTVCGWGDLASEARAQWLQTYGGNPGIVITPSPADWQK